MSQPVRFLAFAGSLRRESFNRRLIHTLVAGAKGAGAEVELIELRDFQLPIYDADLEAEGMPDTVHRLQEKMAVADGLLIATPEYNGSIPALLKNTLDWMSRPQANGDSGVELFKGKIAGISSASPGGLGGLRSLLILRDTLSKLDMWVAPSQMAIGSAFSAFDESGALIDERRRMAVEGVAKQAVEAAIRFRGA